jgi:alkylation response protein AidB-like acyl-CoA dehydrogenase
MDLSLSDRHRALQDQVRAFIREHGHLSPKLGGGRKRPDQKALDWQKRLVDHGYVARTIPRAYGGFGAEPDVLEAAVIAAEFAAAGIYAGLTNQGISMLVP